MDAVITLMKTKGQRLTSQKKEVLQALKNTPQTVLEILKKVESKNGAIDKTTIYRILTSFMELDIVREVHLGDREARFELKTDTHHHHLICEDCGDIEDIEICAEKLLSRVETTTTFKVKSHILEFFGTCKKCQ